MSKAISVAGAVLAAAMLVPPASLAATLTTIYPFGAAGDGNEPLAAVLNVGGILYGTTDGGGNDRDGTVFGVDPTTQAETFLYSAHLVQAGLDAALITVGNTLYGTSNGFHRSSYGSVFKISLATGHYTTVYSFSGGSDGSTPAAALLDVGGTAYGTTSGGGAFDLGTVFSIDLATGAETVVYSFAGGSDGATPLAALINVRGMLYGTTSAGGGGAGCVQCGTVFKIDPGTGAETVLHVFSFDGSDGYAPDAALLYVGGMLYGTTPGGGGDCGCGTVFAIDPISGAETVLHAFGTGKDGTAPQAGLINANGYLYGTTEYGGDYNVGTIFRINPYTGAYNVIHNFVYTSDGAEPRAGLVSMGGALYGTTSAGGPSNGGTVFSLTP